MVIIYRWSGGVRATPVGRDFLRMARSILEQIDALVATARATGRGETGRIAIGFCTSLTRGSLRATIVDFKQRFPRIAVGTVERSRARLTTALRNGVIDVHITTGDREHFDNKVMPLWSERILVVLSDSHPLAACEVIYWTDLRGQTVLLSQYDPGRELERLLNAKLLATSDRPQIERHDVSRGAIKNLVSMDSGISLVLESDTGASLCGLLYRELRDGSGPGRIDFSAVWRPDNENPALANFLDLLRERYPLTSAA